MSANNVSIEEENIVEYRDEKDLEADSGEVDSAIQACVACILISLNE
jgi:hypothetical protein